jgi:outer membrane protein TolC
MALYRFRDADRKMDLYGDTLVPKATESLKVTEQSFRTGDASFLDLIDAQRTYLEFALAHQRALADHEQSLAKVEMLVGKNTSTSGNETAPMNVQDDGSKK